MNMEGTAVAGKRRSVGRATGGVAPAGMPVATSDAHVCVWRPLPTDGRRRRSSWATTWASRLGHCADMNGAPLTRTPPRRSWGRGPPPPGWRRIQARRATCLLRVFYCELCSAPTGRVPGYFFYFYCTGSAGTLRDLSPRTRDADDRHAAAVGRSHREPGPRRPRCNAQHG